MYILPTMALCTIRFIHICIMYYTFGQHLPYILYALLTWLMYCTFFQQLSYVLCVLLTSGLCTVRSINMFVMYCTFRQHMLYVLHVMLTSALCTYVLLISTLYTVHSVDICLIYLRSLSVYLMSCTFYWHLSYVLYFLLTSVLSFKEFCK